MRSTWSTQAACFVTFDLSERFVLVANYCSGTVAVFPLDGTRGVLPMVPQSCATTATMLLLLLVVVMVLGRRLLLLPLQRNEMSRYATCSTQRSPCEHRTTHVPPYTLPSLLSLTSTRTLRDLLDPTVQGTDSVGSDGSDCSSTNTLYASTAKCHCSCSHDEEEDYYLTWMTATCHCAGRTARTRTAL